MFSFSNGYDLWLKYHKISNVELLENYRKNLESVYLDSEQTSDIRLGKKIEYLGYSTSQKLKLYDHNERFIGIGEGNLMSEILPKRLFV